MAPHSTALVLGGGLSGMLAAHQLAPHVDIVTVVERDRFPEGPVSRKGVPQAHHAHLLLARGARILDRLMPGTLRVLADAGAHRIAMPQDIAILTPQGWLPRDRDVQFFISCSRQLTDWAVREHALRNGRIVVHERTDVLGLTGDPQHITGARVRDRETGAERTESADLVVDATGRTSRMASRTERTVLPAMPEEVVDAGVAYASRLFRPDPEVARRVGAVYIQTDPMGGARGGGLLPIEGGRWIVTLVGMRGSEPPTDEEGFTAFARTLRHPAVADLIAGAEPLTPVRGHRGVVNRRLRSDRLARWPRGLVVLGDAACSFNPAYGQGMSTALLGAAALRRGLRLHGTGPGLAAHVQRAILKDTTGAWLMAVGGDLRHPLAEGGSPGRLDRFQHWYTDRVFRAATGRPAATRALLDVFTLSRPPGALLSPPVMLAALAGPGRRAQNTAPLSANSPRTAHR